ncbi:MAG: hypothetical protein M1608_14510, partial [Candidatus Omnitrophica bacterium]|nr:hypothetical protein [Candidatus Omnitrophota bacterium]
EFSGEPGDLKWAVQLAAGFMAGFERRRESRMPMFGDNGAFYGHFHCVASGLVGMVKLGKLLYSRGRPAEGKKLLQLAGHAYQWMLNGPDNLNRVCSCGYSPENSGTGLCGGSELCSAADVVELAAALADCAGLDAEFAGWADYWDDVERFARNEIQRSQLPDPELVVRQVMGDQFKPGPEAISVLSRFRGGWIGSRNFPNNLVQFVRTGGAGSPAGFSPRIEVGGCCLYSGPRGLYACWSSAVGHSNRRSQIRMAVDYQDEVLTMRPLADGGLEVRLKQDRSLEVRPPMRVAKETVTATVDGQTVPFTWSEDRRWAHLAEVRRGGVVRVRWTPARWSSREVVGPANNGELGDAPTGQRVEFELQYRDNDLVGMAPQGKVLPF